MSQEEEEDEIEEEEEEEEDVDALLEGDNSGISHSTTAYKEGSFVIARYDDEWYLAQVDISQEETPSGYTRLRYMSKSGHNRFKWDQRDDKLDTFNMDILLSVPDPIPVASRFVGVSEHHAKLADQLLLVQVVLISLLFYTENLTKKLIFFKPEQFFFSNNDLK